MENGLFGPITAQIADNVVPLLEGDSLEEKVKNLGMILEPRYPEIDMGVAEDSVIWLHANWTEIHDIHNCLVLELNNKQMGDDGGSNMIHSLNGNAETMETMDIMHRVNFIEIGKTESNKETVSGSKSVNSRINSNISEMLEIDPLSYSILDMSEESQNKGTHARFNSCEMDDNLDDQCKKFTKNTCHNTEIECSQPEYGSNSKVCMSQSVNDKVQANNNDPSIYKKGSTVTLQTELINQTSYETQLIEDEKDICDDFAMDSLSIDLVSTKEAIKSNTSNEDQQSVDIKNFNKRRNTILKGSNSKCENKNLVSANKCANPKTKKIPNEKIIKCPKCSYKTTDMKYIYSHLERKHLALVCGKCNKKFTIAKDLSEHIKSHNEGYVHKIDEHNDKDSLKEKQNMSESNQTSNLWCKETEDASLQCQKCDFVAKRPSYLRLHYKRIHAKKSFKCNICSKAFGLEVALRSHALTHSEDTKVSCTICGKVLKNKLILRIHVQGVHKKAIPNTSCLCSFCGKLCRNKTDLDVHLNKEHLKIKPYKCDLCDAAFHSKAILKEHKNSHLAHPHHFCDICGSGFKFRQALRLHKLIHSERQYKCNQCGREFTQCGALRRHMRLHSGEKPYHCHICYSAFSDNSVLRRHMLGFHKLPTFEYKREIHYSEQKFGSLKTEPESTGYNENNTSEVPGSSVSQTVVDPNQLQNVLQQITDIENSHTDTSDIQIMEIPGITVEGQGYQTRETVLHETGESVIKTEGSAFRTLEILTEGPGGGKVAQSVLFAVDSSEMATESEMYFSTVLVGDELASKP